MGMYDYLSEEQIKIFYSPIFNKSDIVTNEPDTWHSGGQLRDFDESSELPLKTWYYKYPPNFIVFDFRWDSKNVWVIRDGKFKEFKSYTKLIEDDLGETVYDYYGNELNIKTLQDFHDIKIDEKYTKELHDKYEKEFFPEGVFNVIKNRTEYYNSVKDEWDKIREKTYGAFNKKWYFEDKYKLEKQLGEYLECLFYLGVMKDGEVYEWHNPMEEYLACKTAMINFIKNNDEIVDKYISWLELTPEEEKDIREIIQEINA
jgi:hypothetical protein